MKNTTRILGVILTLLMVLTLAVTVAAEDVLKSEPWVAPENGVNIIAGNKTCVVKSDRGEMPEMTDGIVTDKAGDNFWTAGQGGHAVPVENPRESTCSVCNKPECGAWFQVNLGEMREIDIIRIVTMLDDTAVYRWEIYATDDASKPVTEWELVGAKTTDEVSTADGYAIYLDEPIQVTTLRVYGTYCSLSGSDNRFRISEIELWDVTVPEETPGENETPR